MPPIHSIYEALPLTPGAGQFRLLSFDLTEPDRIKLKLHVQDFHDAPEYTALPYTWGSLEAQKQVCINDCDLPMTQNLWHFLRELGQRREHRYFWIDALCIDLHAPDRSAWISFIACRRRWMYAWRRTRIAEAPTAALARTTGTQ